MTDERTAEEKLQEYMDANPDFARLAEEAHQAYVDAVRPQDIDESWKYTENVLSASDLEDFIEAIGEENLRFVSMFRTDRNVRSTFFYSPVAVERAYTWLSNHGV